MKGRFFFKVVGKPFKNANCTRRISGLLQEFDDQRQAALIGIYLLLSSCFNFLMPLLPHQMGRVQKMLVSYGEDLPMQGHRAEWAHRAQQYKHTC